jgi:hypothetical protein
MRKTILSIAIALALFSSAFAKAPSNIKDKAVASFQRDYQKAFNVSWVVTDSYVLAQFQIDKETMFAYYDFDGNLIGLIHHMLSSDLSSDLQKYIKKNYSNYWISELFQISSDQGVYYYIELKNADGLIVLTTEDTGSWHRYPVPKQIIEKL